jgi:hypothetical protein
MLMGLICDIEICQMLDSQLAARVKVPKHQLKNFEIKFNLKKS